MLRIEGLSRPFGGVYAVRDVSVDVAEGELRGIIGPNGAGKSTLFNLDQRTPPPHARADHLPRRADRGPPRARACQARHRHRVSGRAHLPGHDRARERHGGRPRADTAWLPRRSPPDASSQARGARDPPERGCFARAGRPRRLGGPLRRGAPPRPAAIDAGGPGALRSAVSAAARRARVRTAGPRAARARAADRRACAVTG